MVTKMTAVAVLKAVTTSCASCRGHGGYLLQSLSKSQWSAYTMNWGDCISVPGPNLSTAYQWPPGHNLEGQYSGHLAPSRLLSDTLSCKQILLKNWSVIKLVGKETVFWFGREEDLATPWPAHEIDNSVSPSAGRADECWCCWWYGN